MTARVAVFEGEDASPEAVRPVLGLLEHLGLPIEFESSTDDQDEQRRLIDATDCALFGATSGRSAQALFHLRWGRQTYANIRPVTYLAGAKSPMADPSGIDFVIVRENLEDVYVSMEGELADLPADLPPSRTMRRPLAELGAGGYAIKAISTLGTERVVRRAFELAASPERRGRLTVSSKFNMLPRTDGLFVEVAKRLAAEFPTVELEALIVDDLAHRLVTQPSRFDVIVLPNLYGDILSDLGAGLIGGLGLAPSGCYGDDYAYFEPAHGTAPDLAGTGTINPTATLLAACMMLDHLGHGGDAHRVRRAVAETYEHGGVLTPDQGGSATAVSFCHEVERVLDAAADAPSEHRP